MNTIETPKAHEGVVINANGACKTVKPANGVEFTLDELKTFVEGYIEGIQLDNNMWAFCNEEGKLQDLQINFAATMYCRDHGWYDHDFLVGNIIICGEGAVS